MPSLRHVSVPVLCAAAAALAAPCAAHAQHGGTEAAPEPQVASASSGPVSVSARAGAVTGSVTRIRGAIPAQEAGRTVTVERLDPLSEQWTPIAHAVARDDGRFVARWKAKGRGPTSVRARVEAPSASTASAAPEITITVFRGAKATWYGPGFYGRRTACGQKMTRALQGVAHRKLRCGTQISLFYDGRTITVPVVDRGPFVKGVRWDLTAATAQALGFTATDRVGALRDTARR